MTSWFVSTTRRVGRDIEWLLTACANEDAARDVAAKALVRGLRVEAGTAPGIKPRVRIGWIAAHHWAQSSNDRAIMGLRRRLREFAA
jgi:hypothetical protein